MKVLCLLLVPVLFTLCSCGENPGLNDNSYIGKSSISRVNDLIIYPDMVRDAALAEAERCMRLKGHTREVEYYIPQNISVRSMVIPRELSVKAARESGYDRNYHSSIHEPVLTDSEKDDYYGTGETRKDGGCLLESLSRVFGSKELAYEYTMVVNSVLPYVNNAITSDVAIDIDNEWALCMKGKGYDYPSPSRAIVSVEGKHEAHRLL